MKESLEEFKARIRKIREPRKHKVRNSLGIRDAFLYVQSNKWLNIGQSLNEQQFQRIIRNVNNLLAKELMNGNSIIFPERMGLVEVRKSKRYVRTNENGKIETNYRVDWDKTLELWSQDSESYQKRKLIRDLDSKNFFGILYNKTNANFNNKWYFTFKASRTIQRMLAQNIRAGQIEAYCEHGNAIR